MSLSTSTQLHLQHCLSFIAACSVPESFSTAGTHDGGWAGENRNGKQDSDRDMIEVDNVLKAEECMKHGDLWLVQMLTYAAEAGHLRLALRAWECMEYALLPTEPPFEGELAILASFAVS